MCSELRVRQLALKSHTRDKGKKRLDPSSLKHRNGMKIRQFHGTSLLSTVRPCIVFRSLTMGGPRQEMHISFLCTLSPKPSLPPCLCPVDVPVQDGIFSALKLHLQKPQKAEAAMEVEHSTRRRGHEEDACPTGQDFEIRTEKFGRFPEGDGES